MMHNHKSTFSPAFTIIELLVVIAVIGILAAITLVSYSGVSTRATIASMQSDLSNASTKLRLYQTENGVLPTTAANAIAAKLISPNPSMDYYSYGVDNISNPQYFCYMYREGTDVYAVDSYSAPSKGVCLTNLVTNGDLSLDGNFDGLADNWSASNVVSKSLSNNTQSFIASASWAGAGTTVASKVVGDSYYTSALVRASSNIVVLGNNVGSVTYHSGSGNYERLSTVVVANINTLAPTIYDLRSSGWDTVYVRYVLCIDLTATFGAGYELTKAQMDTIMNGYSNNWFNITTKVSL